MNFLKSIHREIAWHSLRVLIFLIGIMATGAYFCSLRWFFMLLSVAFFAAAWWTLYTFELNYRRRRMERFSYD